MREVDLQPGTRVELISLRTQRRVHCEIQDQLGAGGTAKVYGGRLSDGGHAVIKAQRYQGELDPGFEVEVELFNRLAHRNVVHCVGVGASPDKHLLLAFRRAYQNPLLLMTQADVTEGMRRDHKALYASLPLDTAIDMGYELLNALAYVEKLGFVHHDVKLANLMIDIAPREEPLEDQEVFGVVVRREYRGVLIDFGAARSRSYLEAYSRGEPMEDGIPPQITPYYAPPESVVETRREDGSLGRTFHPSLDLYAAATLLYAMITGHPPYSHLKAPPNPNDLESIISVKSAERRGEIKPIVLETVRRVVYEDTRFTGGDRAAFDQGLFNFLIKRFDPDPAQRGTAKDMKRDFERLCMIRPARGDGSGVHAGRSTVYLPFQQELITVGRGSEHPLLKAARLTGATRKPKPAANSTPAPGPKVDLTSSTLDWLQDIAQKPVEADDPGGPTRRGPTSPNDGAQRSQPRPPAKGQGRARPSTPRRGQSHPKGRRPPPPLKAAPGPRKTGRMPAVDAGVDSTRSTTRVSGGVPPVPNPYHRPLPDPRQAAAPHILLSAVLDDPFMLLKDRGKVIVGRQDDAQIRIRSGLISRHHAEVRWNGKTWVVSDLESMNGTVVNGFRIERERGSCPLHDGDSIKFGGIEFLVRVIVGNVRLQQEPSSGTTRMMLDGDVWKPDHISFQGDLGQLGLKDVLEILEWKKHSGTLTINPPRSPAGNLYLKKGAIVHGESGQGHLGMDAAVRLMSVRAGSFTFTRGVPRCRPTITKSLEELWTVVRSRAVK
jgi:serine/threonine protein kinase/pSer/pThr/pTyr-binding forkhead associated (FHA) protein